MLAPLAKGSPFAVEEQYDTEPGLPSGFARPVLAVPAANPLRCFALALYGPHASGAELDANERAMLGRIAQHAAAVYAEIENDELRRADLDPRAEAVQRLLAPRSVQSER